MPDFVRLHSLTAVQRYAERTKPWRGCTGKWPLTQNRRSDIHNLICDHECWDLRMYYTAVIRYYDDGRIRLCPYNSVTTVQFAGNFVPKGVTAMTHRGLMYFRIPVADGYHYVNDTTTIKPATDDAGEQVYELLTVPGDNGIEYELDKAGAKALRATPWFKKLEVTWKAICALEGHRPLRRRWFEPSHARVLHPETARPVLLEALYHFHAQGFVWKDVYTAAYRNTGLVLQVPVPSTRLPQRSAWDPA